MTSDIDRYLCLLVELETAHKLIRAGFGNLQEIDFDNDFYHLPHQLLASGLERLMKCYISLLHQDRTGSYPDMTFMKNLGHDLVSLHDAIRTKYYGGVSRPLIQQELDFLNTDQLLQEALRILSLFGKFGRYYNLDVVAGSPHGPIDPKEEWEALERTIEDPAPFYTDMEALHRDYYPRVHTKLISRLERFVRAIALQFTVGDHADQFRNLKTTSTVFTDFRNLRDDGLGTIDYRQSVRIRKQEKHTWLRRSEDEIVNGKWPTRIVEKEEFEGEWPFRAQRVIVELQEQLFAIVNIDDYAFALNGSAASRFKMPFPHDAGMAVLGKSVGPFIDMALTFREEAS